MLPAHSFECAVKNPDALYHTWFSASEFQKGVGQGVRAPPPGKSQVAIGFLRNSGTDPTREAIGPKQLDP